jgi:hypothetical protein
MKVAIDLRALSSGREIDRLAKTLAHRGGSALANIWR